MLFFRDAQHKLSKKLPVSSIFVLSERTGSIFIKIKHLYCKFLRLFCFQYSRQIKTFWGGFFNGIIPEYVSSFIFIRGYHDSSVCRSILFCLEPGSTFIDIGSHFGFLPCFLRILLVPRAMFWQLSQCRQLLSILNVMSTLIR